MVTSPIYIVVMRHVIQCENGSLIVQLWSVVKRLRDPITINASLFLKDHILKDWCVLAKALRIDSVFCVIRIVDDITIAYLVGHRRIILTVGEIVVFLVAKFRLDPATGTSLVV